MPQVKMVINIFVFLLGAIFGSFSNVVIVRKIREESIIYPPSHCDACGKKLKAFDLVPLLSFVLLRGKCRYCKNKIPLDTFVIELVLGLLFLVFFDISNILYSFFLLAALSLGLIISIIDLKTFDIYMSQIGILSILGLLFRYLYIGFDWRFFRVLAIFSLIYGLIFLISNKSIGNGDIYFYLSLMTFIPTDEIIWLILYSIWVGAIFAIVIAIRKGSTKVKIPFCIYIYVAFVLVLFKMRYLL